MSAPRISHPTGQVNFSYVTIDRVTYWFSYETVVAVERNGTQYVAQNRWSATTGKHLNYIDGGSKEAKAARLSEAVFDHVVEHLPGSLHP